MMHDTYYVVAHFEWVLFLALVSVCLFALVTLIKRRSPHALVQKLATLSARIWVLGLVVILVATVAMRVISMNTYVDNLWLIQLINTSLTVGIFFLLLAIIGTAATLLLALWALFNPKPD